jgi:hypothetical protein
MSDITETGSDFLKDLGDSVRRNPISAALVGMGVLWLFTGGRTVERVGSLARGAGLDRLPDVAGSAVDTARSTVRAGAESVVDRISSVTGMLRDTSGAGLDQVTRAGSQALDSAYDYAQAIPEQGSALFETARDGLSELFRTQPLALGAIGVAIGAGIAAALPVTDLESEYFGETSDRLKEQAVDLATDQVARAADVAEDVVSTVTEEARKQGLTLDAAKSAVGDIPAKAGRVVDAAKQGISERAKSAVQ